MKVEYSIRGGLGSITINNVDNISVDDNFYNILYHDENFNKLKLKIPVDLIYNIVEIY